VSVTTIDIDTRPPSRRARGLGTEAAFEVLGRAQAIEARGREVLHLEIGEPGVPTSPHVVEAAVRALRDGRTGYAPPAGVPALREAVAADLVARGIPAKPGSVVVTAGAKPALFFAFHTLLEPGDEALVPDPGFPVYASVVRACGARPVSYRLDRHDGFTLDPASVAEAVSPRTRVLVLNQPHNPTGAAAEPAALDAVADLAVRYGLTVVADEVYHRFRYGPPHPGIAARPGLAERTVVVDSFSKTYAMTGWRLGYAHLPAPLVEPFTRYVINALSCTPPFVQAAGLAALAGSQEWVTALVAALARRRAEVVAALATIPGVTCPPPAGAYYAFPEVPGIIPDFASRLLETEGVALLDGSGFGAGGKGHVRLSFAASEAVLREALVRIRRFVETAA
jgi:aspartate/methionine/tyrosine aminotransferase